MKRSVRYLCPKTKEPLNLDILKVSGDDVVEGVFRSNSGEEYAIRGGIPDFLLKATVDDHARRVLDEYDKSAQALYDAGNDWLFRSFYENEETVRNGLIDRLELRPDHCALEAGCGTGCDSVWIQKRLGADGRLFLQDLSFPMLEQCRARVQAERPQCAVEYHCGNALHLPFEDNAFDAAYHFGGLNLFSDARQFFSEIARVVRDGGRVVAGDESLAPWLRETEYGKILVNSNSLYNHAPPLSSLPRQACDVNLHWLLGNAFYAISFRVGAAPKLDLDLPIPGKRGGTHRTRYYGRLEGVGEEAKAQALQAAERQGVSCHEWLEKAIRHFANKESSG